MLTSAAVNSMAALPAPLSGISYSSTPFVPKTSVPQMPTMDDQPHSQRQPLSAIVNSVQTTLVESSAVPSPIVSSHRLYVTAAATDTAIQPLSSGNQVQSTADISQPLNCTNDQLIVDSSAVLKRVSISKFAGNKKQYEA